MKSPSPEALKSVMRREKDDILREIALEQTHLSELDRRRDEARTRIALLESELDAASGAESLDLQLRRSDAEAPRTAAEKVSVFRSLFRGRTDVFPTRFVSKKTGKSGYSPACTNKWEPGICALTSGGKCGECANQAFIPVSDREILGHLQGRHVMGVYPLLNDETCWFVAADFDKSTWKDDIAAFRETCDNLGTQLAATRV